VKEFWDSTIGKKVAVAVGGSILVGYLVLHMAGNLWSLAGPGTVEPHIDEYAHWLRTFGGPLIPYEGVLWVVRAILLAALVVHVVGTVQLKARNRRARPAEFPQRKIGRSWESRLMMVSGVAILAFVIIHILQFTTLTIDFTPLTEGAIYSNLYFAFQEWYWVVFYLAAIFLVGSHLRHAVWSVFQTLGLDSPERNEKIRVGASLLTVVIVVGFASVPVLFFTGALDAPTGNEAISAAAAAGGKGS
jgi:succinate dehydrogenase / fumarate reductase cytochrome b subunit